MKDEILAACVTAAFVLIIGGVVLFSYSETIRVPSQSPYRLYEEVVVHPYREQGVQSVLVGVALLAASIAGFVVSRGEAE